MWYPTPAYPVAIPVSQDVPEGIQRWVRAPNSTENRTTWFYQQDADGFWRIRRNGERVRRVSTAVEVGGFVRHLSLVPIWGKSMKVRKGL